jgi:hypothetical protein
MSLRQAEGEKTVISIALDEVICPSYGKMQSLQKSAQERRDRAESLPLLGSKAICDDACPCVYV